MLPQTIFSGTILLVCWLIKKTNLLAMMIGFGNLIFALEILPFSTSSTAPREEGKMVFYETAIFPLLFELFCILLVLLWQT
jgi:hypothetical protein